MLPEKDGFTVLKELRQRHRDIPVLVMTARNFEADVLKGFDLGADDYVTKPFGIKELMARVKRLVPRGPSGAPAPGPTIYKFGDVEVRFEPREVYKAGKQVALSFKEFELLKYLIEHRGRTVSREELLEEIWGVDEELGVTTRTVDTHVSNLRSKLGAGFEQPFIVAVHKVGYKFVEPLEQPGTASSGGAVAEAADPSAGPARRLGAAHRARPLLTPRVRGGARELRELVERERLAAAARVDAGVAAQALDAVLAEPERLLERVQRAACGACWNEPRMMRNSSASLGTSTGGCSRRKKRTSMLSTSGRGQNADGPHRHERLEQRVVAREQRERAVLRRARGGGEPLGVLLLHQQHRAAHHAPLLEQALEDRRGDVVGDVADHHQLAPPRAPRATAARSNSRKSPSTISTRGSSASSSRSSSASPSSFSTAIRCAHAARDPRRERAGAGADLDRDVVRLDRWQCSTMRSARSSRTRKFWPKRLRGESPRSASACFTRVSSLPSAATRPASQAERGRPNGRPCEGYPREARVRVRAGRRGVSMPGV